MKYPFDEKYEKITVHAVSDIREYVDEHFSDLTEERRDTLVIVILHTCNKNYYAGMKHIVNDLRSSLSKLKDIFGVNLIDHE